MTLVDLDRVPDVVELATQLLIGGVVIDVETTGLGSPRILELGGWSSRGAWASVRVNPGPDAAWEPEASAVHGLTPDDVSHAEGWVVVGHRARRTLEARATAMVGSWGAYDHEVVAAELRRVGLPPWPVQWVDVMRLARRLDPTLQPGPSGRVRLVDACGHYHVTPGRHRALADARAAYEVLQAAWLARPRAAVEART